MDPQKADHPPARVFKITVDNRPFDWPQPFITGAEVKRLVNAKPEYGVWLVVPGPADDDEIADNERVDLTQPGRERFITGPKQTTEGDGTFLPSRDRKYLEDKVLPFEEVTADGQRGVIIRNYPLPAGVFDASHTDILILIPTGYPDAAPDMFYTLPWVKLIARNALPRAADQPHAFAGKSWQRWSRHNPEWRAGIDGIWTMLKRVHHALQVAAA